MNITIEIVLGICAWTMLALWFVFGLAMALFTKYPKAEPSTFIERLFFYLFVLPLGIVILAIYKAFGGKTD